jgi:hypothetical protein
MGQVIDTGGQTDICIIVEHFITAFPTNGTCDP